MVLLTMFLANMEYLDYFGGKSGLHVRLYTYRTYPAGANVIMATLQRIPAVLAH